VHPLFTTVAQLLVNGLYITYTLHVRLTLCR